MDCGGGPANLPTHIWLRPLRMKKRRVVRRLGDEERARGEPRREAQQANSSELIMNFWTTFPARTPH